MFGWCQVGRSLVRQRLQSLGKDDYEGPRRGIGKDRTEGPLPKKKKKKKTVVVEGHHSTKCEETCLLPCQTYKQGRV